MAVKTLLIRDFSQGLVTQADSQDIAEKAAARLENFKVTNSLGKPVARPLFKLRAKGPDDGFDSQGPYYGYGGLHVHSTDEETAEFNGTVWVLAVTGYGAEDGAYGSRVVVAHCKDGDNPTGDVGESPNEWSSIAKYSKDHYEHPECVSFSPVIRHGQMRLFAELDDEGQVAIWHGWIGNPRYGSDVDEKWETTDVHIPAADIKKIAKASQLNVYAKSHIGPTGFPPSVDAVRYRAIFIADGYEAGLPVYSDLALDKDAKWDESRSSVRLVISTENQEIDPRVTAIDIYRSTWEINTPGPYHLVDSVDMKEGSSIDLIPAKKVLLGKTCAITGLNGHVGGWQTWRGFQAGPGQGWYTGSSKNHQSALIWCNSRFKYPDIDYIDESPLAIGYCGTRWKDGLEDFGRFDEADQEEIDSGALGRVDGEDAVWVAAEAGTGETNDNNKHHMYVCITPPSEGAHYWNGEVVDINEVDHPEGSVYGKCWKITITAPDGSDYRLEPSLGGKGHKPPYGSSDDKLIDDDFDLTKCNSNASVRDWRFNFYRHAGDEEGVHRLRRGMYLYYPRDKLDAYSHVFTAIYPVGKPHLCYRVFHVTQDDLDFEYHTHDPGEGEHHIEKNQFNLYIAADSGSGYQQVPKGATLIDVPPGDPIGEDADKKISSIFSKGTWIGHMRFGAPRKAQGSGDGVHIYGHPAVEVANQPDVGCIMSSPVKTTATRLR